MYTIDDIRQEAIAKVKRWYVEADIQPSLMAGNRAWGVLAHIAKMHPDWRVSRYYWNSGSKEERQFCAEWEAWREQVNG